MQVGERMFHWIYWYWCTVWQVMLQKWIVLSLRDRESNKADNLGGEWFWRQKSCELTMGKEYDDSLSEVNWFALECRPPRVRAWNATILREQLTLYLLAQEVEQNLFGPRWWCTSVRQPHCSQCPMLESSTNTSLKASSLLDRLSAAFGQKRPTF